MAHGNLLFYMVYRGILTRFMTGQIRPAMGPPMMPVGPVPYGPPPGQGYGPPAPPPQYGGPPPPPPYGGPPPY